MKIQFAGLLHHPTRFHLFYVEIGITSQSLIINSYDKDHWWRFIMFRMFVFWLMKDHHKYTKQSLTVDFGWVELF